MKNTTKQLTMEELDSILNGFTEEQKLICRQEEVQMTFIRNLIRVRKEKGISQQKLAELTGLTQQVVSSFEQCDRKPTLPNLIKYLLGIGIDINKVFD